MRRLPRPKLFRMQSGMGLVLGALAVGLALAAAAVGAGWPTPLAPNANVVAIVNDEIITRDDLAASAMQEYAAEMLERLILEKLISQEAARRNISYSPEEFSARLNTDVIREIRLMALRHASLYQYDPADFPRRLEQEGRSLEALQNMLEKRLRMRLGPQLLLEKLALADVAITDVEIAAAFEERFGPKAIVRQVVVATQAEAEEAAQRLRAGANFTALISEKSIDEISRAKGGLLPPLSPNGPLGKAAFALRPGEVSSIIRTDDGYHIVQLEQLTSAAKLTLDEVREELREELRVMKARDEQETIINNLLREAKIIRASEENLGYVEKSTP